MRIDYTPTVLLLVAGLPLGFYLLWYGWRNRTKPGALPFVVIMALSTSWTIESAFELLSTDFSAKLLWADLQYLSICFLPLACWRWRWTTPATALGSPAAIFAASALFPWSRWA